MNPLVELTKYGNVHRYLVEDDGQVYCVIDKFRNWYLEIKDFPEMLFPTPQLVKIHYPKYWINM